MTIKHTLKMTAQRLGYEITRYNAVESTEARLMAMLRTQRIDTVFDVGANDGGYAQSLRRGGFDGEILSFEPLEAEHARLSDRAKGDRSWHVAPRMALGSVTREVEIHVAGNSTSSSILPMLASHQEAAPHSRYVGTQRVQVRRLDEVHHPAIEAARRPLLKIDTQGFEHPVLEGCTGLLDRIMGIQLELSVTPLYEGQVLYFEMVEWLRVRGFELWGVIPGFVDPRNARMLQFDGVFFRDSSY